MPYVSLPPVHESVETLLLVLHGSIDLQNSCPYVTAIPDSNAITTIAQLTFKASFFCLTTATSFLNLYIACPSC